MESVDDYIKEDDKIVSSSTDEGSSSDNGSEYESSDDESNNSSSASSDYDDDDDDDDDDANDDDDDDWYTGTVVTSGDGTSKLWKPNVKKEYFPDKNITFETEDDAVAMYAKYAIEGGFVERKSTTRRFADKSIRLRYVVCNRAGKLVNKSCDTLDTDGTGKRKRNSNSIVCDCKAHIIFERSDIRTNVFKIKDFQELHNHPLDSKDERRHSKKARQLTIKDKELIVRGSTANLGATKAHKLRVCLAGGHDKVGPKAIDYKNFRKKMSSILGDKDAQIVVDLMDLRKEESVNMTFEYKCVGSVLNAMFWADDTDKLYYKEFGDVISFDATFRTNKYGMVFVPFTAIDNHKRSITVGAGLLSNETIESYTWLLKSFLIAHGKQPRLVLTDQDAAVKDAVANVFPKSIHRLCMWHIMKKLHAKVSNDCMKNTNFRKDFHKLVWNIYLDPEEFENKWHLLMKEYNLKNKSWFKRMYKRRKSWIPAYFKDVPMHGLMKTTSRSESSNSFFNKYAHSGNLLIFFMMNYDTAIEKQRNNHRGLDHATMNRPGRLKMPTKLEEHASKIYTKTIFLEVQNEMYKGAWNCSVESIEVVDGWEVVIISQIDKSKTVKTKCKVEIKLDEKVVKCSCQLFTRMGILCRHAFAVMINHGFDEIPDQYIVRRWGRNVVRNHLLLRKHGCEEVEDETAQLVIEAYNNFEFCVEAVKKDKDKLLAFVENSRAQKKLYETVASKTPTVPATAEEEIGDLLGVKIPEKVNIYPPQGIRNKGCGTKKRIVSASEKACSSAKVKTRMCSGCNKFVNHNWRTCKVRIAREEGEGLN